jgi:integrase/recombinase XerD
MLDLRHSAAAKARVNILKKVKVNGQWKFCAVVVESNGRLKDKVRIDGHVETHSEGIYYIDWREAGRRRREAILSRSQVLERARLKALEIDARRAGVEFEIARAPAAVKAAIVPALRGDVERNPNSANPSLAANFILQGIEHYLREMISSVVRAELTSLGLKSGELPAQIAASAPPAVEIAPADGDASRSAARTSEAGSSDGKISIPQAIESYLKDVEPPQREPKTYDEYRLVLYRFRDTCSKAHIQDIDRNDCLSFMRHLYSIGNEARTVFNRMGIVQQLLKLHGITGLLKGRDKPKFVSNIREMYQPEDLEAIFKACTSDERVPYLFFLLSGERDKEVRYTAWSDIDFVRKCVRVTAKKQLGFKPKDKEEREIPVPSSFLTALKEYKARQSGHNPHNLVFPTKGGKPDKKFENKLKRIAHRAGLNCGRCQSKHGNKCSEGPHCSKWFLHKFRHTYATTCLENGVSIRTLQEWLGHSDLASTMVYLKYVHRKDIHKLVDNSELAELAAHSLECSSTGAPELRA